jgi:glucokinase
MNREITLLVDIGGTHTRILTLENRIQFSADDISPEKVCIYSTRAFLSFEECIKAHLEDLNYSNVQSLTSIRVCAAGPKIDDEIQLTNATWTLSETKLRKAFSSLKRVHLLNDFEALALAIPLLDTKSLRPLGHRMPEELNPKAETCAVVGPGTGFGVAYSVHHPKMGWMSQASEGGHAGLSFESQKVLSDNREAKALCIEDCLSGPGIQMNVEILPSPLEP